MPRARPKRRRRSASRLEDHPSDRPAPGSTGDDPGHGRSVHQLFKDTTLVAIVGSDRRAGRSPSFANTQPDFLGQGLERITLPFMALVFWAGSYTMSREAQRLERRLGMGER